MSTVLASLDVAVCYFIPHPLIRPLQPVAALKKSNCEQLYILELRIHKAWNICISKRLLEMVVFEQ